LRQLFVAALWACQVLDAAAGAIDQTSQKIEWNFDDAPERIQSGPAAEHDERETRDDHQTEEGESDAGVPAAHSLIALGKRKRRHTSRFYTVPI
jgi:hypothetical protein